MKQSNDYLISEELTKLLEYGLYYSKLSNGLFDITIAPLTSLWDFSGIKPVKPTQEMIDAALANVGYQKLLYKDRRISFSFDGMALDLGAIAKGYIADKVKEFLLQNGVSSAMINLGGNVLCVGSKPDGSPFRVGIQKPYADRSEILAVIELTDYSVVSSGIYERFFIMDGINYHHILDPRTGYPFDNNLVAVTIISKKSVDGDGLSTTCYSLGLSEGIKLIDSLPDTYAVFITKEYEIHYSQGFLDAFKITLED